MVVVLEIDLISDLNISQNWLSWNEIDVRYSRESAGHANVESVDFVY